MSNKSQYNIVIKPDELTMNSDCYKIKGGPAEIPKDIKIVFDKCVVSQAEEIFEKFCVKGTLRTFTFPAVISSDSLKGTIQYPYIECYMVGSHRCIDAVFTIKETGVKYEVDFTCYIADIVERELEKKGNIAQVDLSDDSLFINEKFAKCLRINDDHLKPEELELLINSVDDFNQDRSKKKVIQLFKIASIYPHQNSDGLGVLLLGTPWNEVDVKRTLKTDAANVKQSLIDLDLPDNFINIIWKAGYAGVELVIFEFAGKTFSELPEYCED